MIFSLDYPNSYQLITNNQKGIDFLIEQVSATARRRKIPKSQIFFGGEDLPSYVENFAHQLGNKGYLVTRVNAKKAKENRENEIASTDNLALLGIAKTLLSRRARVIADPSETSDPDIYKSIVNLSRSRGRWVKQSTAISNQIHTHVDQLFPGFLDPLQASITPFTEISLDLMSGPRFSAGQFARRKPSALAKQLKTRRRASLSGRTYDLRVLVIGGESSHVVVRTNRSPITNLHLGNARGDVDEVRQDLGETIWSEGMKLSENAASKFPDATMLPSI